jgi:hypothetical protein
MPKLLKIVRDESFVQYRQEVQRTGTAEEQDVTTHEAPLPSFDAALQALAPVACVVLGMGPKYAEGVIVRSLSIGYTKAGTRSATISFTKKLDTPEVTHPLKTPAFRFDDSAEGESNGGRREVANKQAELIELMIEQAEKYIAGERQQQILPLEAGAEPAEGQLVGMEA